MSRTLKWVLGILAVLVVLAIIAGGVWAWQNHAQLMASVRPYAAQPNNPGSPAVPNFPNRGFGYNGNGRNPMGGDGFGFRGPMMGGRGRFGYFGPFGMGLFFFGGLLRLLIPLVMLVVVAIIFYQIGKRAGANAVVRREPVPAVPSDQTPPQSQ